jgi:hypothetical protein
MHLMQGAMLNETATFEASGEALCQSGWMKTIHFKQSSVINL